MNSEEICKKISIQLFQDIAFDNTVSVHSGNRKVIENLLKELVLEIKKEIKEENIRSHVKDAYGELPNPYDLNDAAKLNKKKYKRFDE